MNLAVTVWQPLTLINPKMAPNSANPITLKPLYERGYR